MGVPPSEYLYTTQIIYLPANIEYVLNILTVVVANCNQLTCLPLAGLKILMIFITDT